MTGTGADTAGMFYLLVCRECGNGDLVMPFGSAAERGKWAAEHTKATGHDRWFVTESAGRLTGQQVAEMMASHDEFLRVLREQEARMRAVILAPKPDRGDGGRADLARDMRDLPSWESEQGKVPGR